MTIETTHHGKRVSLLRANVVFAQVLAGRVAFTKPIRFDVPLRLMLLRWCDPVTGRHQTTTPISLN